MEAVSDYGIHPLERRQEEAYHNVLKTLRHMPPEEHSMEAIRQTYKSIFNADISRQLVNGVVNLLEAVGDVTFRRVKEGGRTEKYVKLAEK